MIALLLRLAAPLQAWGTQSRFSERDTQLEPSKSGVVGLLAAALGRPRDADLADLASLAMAVRVDREGRKLRDFHTVGGGDLPSAVLAAYGVKTYGVSRANGNTPEAAISARYYLADARFLVALGSPDRAFLLQLAEALRRPVHPLFLGRKSCVPSEPVLHDGQNPLREGGTLRAILEAEPWDSCDQRIPETRRPRLKEPSQLRIVQESPDGSGGVRQDLPVSFARGARAHANRAVQVQFITRPVPTPAADSTHPPETSP